MTTDKELAEYNEHVAREIARGLCEGVITLGPGCRQGESKGPRCTVANCVFLRETVVGLKKYEAAQWRPIMTASQTDADVGHPVLLRDDDCVNVGWYHPVAKGWENDLGFLNFEPTQWRPFPAV